MFLRSLDMGQKEAQWYSRTASTEKQYSEAARGSRTDRKEIFSMKNSEITRPTVRKVCLSEQEMRR